MKKLTALLLSFLLILCACQQPETADLSKFEIVNQQLYIQDGKECLSYRMIVSCEPTDDELFAAIGAVLDDGYYLHTVWFYNTIEEVNGRYTVAMAEQDADDILTLKKKGGNTVQRPIKK